MVTGAPINGLNGAPLVAPNGQPIVREVLAQPERMAGATLLGVRQAVGAHITGGLGPEDLALILREAEDGDPELYLQLAEEMEEKDPHYASVLGTRKRQVAQLETSVEAAGKDELSKKIAADVQATFVDSGLIDAAMFDMLDAVGKGFSIMEVMWKTSGSRWWPGSLEYSDPRFFWWDRATRTVPLLKGNDGTRLPLPPYRFVVTRIRAKSGIPIRGGIARAVCWNWMFKTFSLKNWVQFSEIYGIPFRLGKYAPGTPPGDIDKLLRAVISIANDAGAAIPNNMDISFVETKSGNGDGAVFAALAKYCDDQTSKLVLGQTGTTDATGARGLGSGTEHQQVREDIERADANELTSVLNRQAVRPFVDLNYGPQAKYPFLRIGRPEAKDVAMQIDAAARLIPLGWRIKAAQLRAITGFDDPLATDEVITPPAGAPSSGGNAVPPVDLRAALAHARGVAELLALETAGDAIARAAREQDPELMAGAVKQLLHAAAISSNEHEFRRRLQALNGAIDVSPLADDLALRMFQALAGGIVGDTLSRQQKTN